MGTEKSRWWAPKISFACLFAASLALPGVGPALAPGPDQATRKQGQAKWEADLRRYQEIDQWIREHGNSRPEVPVPPKLSYPCKACGEEAEGPSESETAANAFVDKAGEPEWEMARDMLRIARDVAHAGDDPSIPPALRGLKDGNVPQQASWLTDRVCRRKAQPMVNKYGKIPEMAYAGIKFLLVAKRQNALVSSGEEGCPSLAEAAYWLKSIEDRIDKDIFKGYKYNLCPNLIAILREMQLLGAEEGEARFGLEELLRMVPKMDDFLHFDLEMDWESENGDPSSKEGGMRFRWRAKGLFHLKVEIARGCFTPELVPAQQVQVDLLEYAAGNAEHQARYEGPRRWEVPAQALKLTLCDEQPQLTLQFTDFGPQGAVLVVPGTPAVAQEKAITGFFIALTGNEFAKQLQGPQGEKAMQDLTRMATGAGASGGVNIGINQVKVPWTNGTARPVDKTLEVNEGDAKMRLKVSLLQHPKGAGAGAQ